MFLILEKQFENGVRKKMNDRKIVIIIPTYNEELGIEHTIHEVFKITALIKNFYILIFDSCSTDNTQHIVSRLQKTYDNLYLQTEPKKTGLGSAYWQAMRYSLDQLKASIVIEFDADLSHQPHYLLPIIEQMQFNDVVIGSRYVQGGSIPNNWGVHRKLLSQFGNRLSRIILTTKYNDFTSGFRATHYIALDRALPKQFISNNYAYKLELLWNLHKLNAKILEYPIEFIDRKVGYSKMPTNSIIDSLKVLASLRLKELKSYGNMCLVGGVGLIIQILVYNILRLSFPPLFSAQLAIIAAIINNFILNNQFTFNKRKLTHRFKNFASFMGFSFLMINFQSHWVQWGIDYYGSGSFKENFLVISGVALGSVLNYIFYSRIIWRKKQQLSSNTI
jgi:dolichol-phosphate mannosyltransferase